MKVIKQKNSKTKGENKMNKYMKIAKENADNGIKNKEGGPFGSRNNR